MKKNILFICKWNRFRSRTAEAFFNKYNKNPKYEAKSAGVVRGHLPLDRHGVAGAKKFGISILGRPHGLTSELILWQDIIVIVADDVPASIFKDNKNIIIKDIKNTIVVVADDVPASIFKDNKKYGKKLIVWKIRDARSNNKKEIFSTIKQIEKKVKKFVEDLR